MNSVLYALPYERELALSEREGLISLLGESCRNRVKGYHYFADKDRSILAEYLSKHMLSKHSGVSFDEIIFQRNCFGKPYWSNDNSLHFNVSHSGKWIICGISETPIGVDIEQVRAVSLENYDSVLSENEKSTLLSNDNNNSFFRIWSAKESYLKAVGQGFSVPPDIIEFNPAEGVWDKIIEGFSPDTKRYDLDSGYICKATVLSGNAPERCINARDLLY